MTQIELARNGVLTEEMRLCAQQEGVSPELVREEVANGRAVIPRNKTRSFPRPCVIGKAFSVKVNANVGTSPDSCSLEEEKEKIRVAISAGADCVMDLSIAGDLRRIRRELLSLSDVPFGTVPIYEVAYDLAKEGRDIGEMGIDDVLAVLEEQAKDGVDFFTLHAGLTRRAVERYVPSRLMKVVSRGGSILAEWIMKNRKENLLYEHFDEILALLKEFDVTISLGDGLRPGAIADATDRAQIEELTVLGELAERAREAGVQVMIEGPGHVPMDQISANMILEDRLCNGAPFYVLGPLPTDVAVGFDHIAGAIGGAIAGWYGASMLCYVTPAEHISHPTREDVFLGVIGTKIAAHCADLARGNRRAYSWDLKMSSARARRDWEEQIRLAIHPPTAEALRKRLPLTDETACSMCGEFCAIKRLDIAKEERQYGSKEVSA